MEFKEEIVHLRQVDEYDETYRITTRSCTNNLVASIKEIGLINTPILEKKGTGTDFIIVSGFRRIAACNLLNIKQIKSRIANSEIPQLDRAKVAISENSFQRVLNLIETSRALNLLSRFPEETDRLSKNASTLALPGNPKMIDTVMQLSLLPSCIQSAVITDTIGLTVALHLGKLEVAAAEILVNIFKKLKLSLNKQRELILLSEEISHREDKSLLEVLNGPPIERMMNDTDMDRSQQGRELRRYLKQRRYPELSHAEALFEKEKKALKLENQIRLLPPANFEGQDYTFYIQFKTLEEFNNRLKTLSRVNEHPSFKKIVS